MEQVSNMRISVQCAVSEAADVVGFERCCWCPTILGGRSSTVIAPAVAWAEARRSPKWHQQFGGELLLREEIFVMWFLH